MSKLARALALAAMLATMSLAGMTAAQAQATDQARQIEKAWRQHQVTAQRQSTADATQAALAQERHYSTWDYQDTSAPATPAEPGGQPTWLVIALAVLAAVLALVTGVAVLAAHRATRDQHAGQTA
jgi:lysylphosphatidylglycerol synthetase-like protein (DUF2156 family)